VGFTDICCSIACRFGEFTGKSHNALWLAQQKLKESTQALNPKNLPEKIKNAIYEKLTRTLYKQAESMMGRISQRLEVMDEVARHFYEKINVLATRGPVSESQLWKAMNSIEAAENLSNEEKVLLVTIFGQFAGVQKSKFVDAVVVEKPTQSSAANKSAALTGQSAKIKQLPKH
jgi:hypothetical protein